MPLTKITTGIIADNTITTSDIATGTIVSGDIADGTITSGDMALDPRNASNLSSGDVPLAQLGNVPVVDLSAQKDDIALLAFKTQANGNLARYNLVDQSVDSFEDASGVNAPASTDANRNSAGKYYSGTVAAGAIQIFKTNGNATYTATVGVISIEVLVVGAGGGGGNYYHGAGGGGGGIVHDTDFTVIGGQAYGLTVGSKGTAGQSGASDPGAPGIDTSFDNAAVNLKLIGKGGGGGAAEGATGKTGGSGGGGTYNTLGGASTQANFAGATSYGSTGGGDTTNRPGNSTGGGGGAGAVGGPGTPDAGGPGGAGYLFPSFVAYGSTAANAASTGSDGGYFGGGGGGATNSVVDNFPNGGVGGGAAGSGADGLHAPPWTPYGFGGTGGGGGGGERAGNYGGDGDNGGVYIKENDTYIDMVLESNTITAVTAPTKADLVFTYSNGIGTAVVGTNVTAEASMDGGTTWTDLSIVPGDVQGTTSGHTIVSKNNVTLTSTSGTSMRWRIKTLVQSAAMSTRIHAVSLGWS